MFDKTKFSEIKEVCVVDNSSLVCTKDQLKVIYCNTIERTIRGEFALLAESYCGPMDLAEDSIKIIGYLDNYRIESYLQRIYASFFINKTKMESGRIVDYCKRSVEIVNINKPEAFIDRVLFLDKPKNGIQMNDQVRLKLREAIWKGIGSLDSVRSRQAIDGCLVEAVCEEVLKIIDNKSMMILFNPDQKERDKLVENLMETASSVFHLDFMQSRICESDSPGPEIKGMKFDHIIMDDPMAELSEAEKLRKQELMMITCDTSWIYEAIISSRKPEQPKQETWRDRQIKDPIF